MLRMTHGCVLVALLAGCRDEQAGPHPRGTRARPSTTLTFRSGASWGDGAIRYVGAQVSTEGTQVRVTNVFQVLRAPTAGWKLFVHLVDARTGQMVANLDHPLERPLDRWTPGETVEDAQRIELPADAAPLRLLLGFWQDDRRLPVDQPGAQDGQDRMLGPVLAGARPELPEYTVQRARAAPRIDGDLSDAVWKDAAAVTLVSSLDGSPTHVRTTARLLWDDANLYVAFDCEDPDAWSTFTQSDEPLYTQEVVEIFLDADGDGRTYDEIEVSPANVLFDAYFPARREGMDLSWDSGTTSAVRVQGTLNDPGDVDRGWTVEMRIPIARLASVPHLPPLVGDRWRFNLYRLEHLGRRQVEGQAFSPVFVGDFHALPRFGWLSFAR